jgi:hypothetical protein
MNLTSSTGSLIRPYHLSARDILSRKKYLIFITRNLTLPRIETRSLPAGWICSHLRRPSSSYTRFLLGNRNSRASESRKLMPATAFGIHHLSQVQDQKMRDCGTFFRCCTGSAIVSFIHSSTGLPDCQNAGRFGVFHFRVIKSVPVLVYVLLCPCPFRVVSLPFPCA